MVRPPADTGLAPGPAPVPAESSATDPPAAAADGRLAGPVTGRHRRAAPPARQPAASGRHRRPDLAGQRPSQATGTPYAGPSVTDAGDRVDVRAPGVVRIGFRS